jgi:predicted deacylase
MLGKTVTVGEVAAAPGETKHGPAAWVELRDATRVPLPVIVINGQEDGPRVVICGATHATELSGTAIIHALRKKVNPSVLKGHIIAFPTANPLAMQFAAYVSPQDGANLAVSYPGSESGSITGRFANVIWKHATIGSSLIMDLHENVAPCLKFTLVGYSKDKETEKKTLEFARAFGLTLIRNRSSDVDTGTAGMKAGDLYWAELGMANSIPGFTVELEGKFESRFDENQPVVRVGVRGVMNTLKKLGMIQGEIEPQTDTLVLKGDFRAWGNIRANRGGLVNRYVDTGVRLAKGTKIAEVINPYGDVTETIEMPIDGYIWAWSIIGATDFNWCVQAGSPIAYLFSEL